ncbi:MAG: mycothiol system anti-sigma-R factor [Ectothiorhodospiraceae bacterium]|nr:mycothiol system anti-sigma-R factor [Ectothiorhodospiraceae bacterium]
MTDHELTCEEVIEQLLTFLDGEIGQNEAAAIERHLERCRDCFTRAEFERRLREKTAHAATSSAPERLRRRIRKLIDSY